MIHRVVNDPLAPQPEVVVVGVYQNEGLSEQASSIDRSLGGLLTRVLRDEHLKGALFEITPVFTPQGAPCNCIYLVGLGDRTKLTTSTAHRVAAATAKRLADRQRSSVAFWLDSDWTGALAEAAIIGSWTGCHGQDLYRAEKKRYPLPEILWPPSFETSLSPACVIAESVDLARTLVNEPPNILDPVAFATRASQVASDCGLELEIWDEPRLREERCGALLAVARGSVCPPRLVLLRHRGGVKSSPDAKPEIALVGKGVTFDSGGLSLKPTDGMKTMKCDMAGAAAVLGTMQAIARLKLPIDVVGILGLVENMPSGNAFRLGDVIKTRAGITVEILNTDAEGRLVLADAISVAVDRGATKIIDLATLTGACVVALGMDVAGILSNATAFAEEIGQAAEACGESMWPLPMFEEFDAQIRSDIADIKNTGEGRWGGAITAAKFLERFVAARPWVHLDIAGPAFLESEKPWQDAGGTGFGVRTLVNWLRTSGNMSDPKRTA